jgi:hypothetical protein
MRSGRGASRPIEPARRRPRRHAVRARFAASRVRGACLFLLADQDAATRTPARTFIPDAGTLALERVSGRLTGRLEDNGPGPLRAARSTEDPAPLER